MTLELHSFNTNQPIGFDNLPAHVKQAGYTTNEVEAGILHIGPGGFWAAHMAAYIHDYMELTEDKSWGFVVASLRSRGTITALRSANFRMILIEREENERCASVINPIVDAIYAPEDPLSLVDTIANQNIRIVSMTLTNKGYCVLDECGTLDVIHPDIVHDLEYIHGKGLTDAPRAVYWYLKCGIEKRMKEAEMSGIPRPLTIMSLDNVPENTKSLKTAFLQYIEASTESYHALFRWIEDNVDFLTTLVDRITPQVSKTFRKEAAEFLSFEPEVVIGTEKFRQLVVEQGRFTVPDWHSVGVETVSDISTLWELKFLGLNAAHQVPAMVGLRLGATLIHEAVLIPEIGALLELFHCELGIILGDDLLAEYAPKIQRRFKDSAPMDTIRRVGARGTSKASERVAYAIERALALTDGQVVLKAATFVFACWMLNLGCTDELGNAFEQDDSEQIKLISIHQDLLAWTRSSDRSPRRLASLLRAIGEICSINRFVVMAGKTSFVNELSWALSELTTGDTKAAINNLLARV
ncbi:mannitol dehydrogenase family protein [soil metagenome]